MMTNLLAETVIVDSLRALSSPGPGVHQVSLQQADEANEHQADGEAKLKQPEREICLRLQLFRARGGAFGSCEKCRDAARLAPASLNRSR